MQGSPTINEVIDERFVLRQSLSQGSVGSIWSATELPLGRPVALKLLRPEVASLPHLRRRFAREARAASRLFHPNVATVIDYGVAEGGRMYIAMELLDGQVVTELIRQGLSPHHILDLADQLLAGLAHAHARGVIHRDLKPANLMVVDGDLPRKLGTVKIVDFGIARVESEPDDRDTAHGEVVGTPRYMSPEQASGVRSLGPRTDLYNVGLILYELIAGRAPFGDLKSLAVMASHVHEEIPPLVPRDELDVPQELIECVGRALEKEPARRWSSAAEMRGVIAHLRRRIEADPKALKVPAPVTGSIGEVHSTVEESAVARPLDVIDEDKGALEVADRRAWKGAVVNARRRTPFVGRHEERRRLQNLVERACRQGQGSLVLLEGEAGVGKTRLTMWLKEWAEEKGLLRAHIGTFTRGSAEGARGLREVLDSIFGTRGVSGEVVAARLAGRLEHWGHDGAVDAEGIANFMRPASAEDAAQTMPRGSAHRQAPTKLFAAVGRVLEITAEIRPRLIILDDLHWASREVGDFLERLAVEMRHRPIPLMIIATVRTEDLSANPALATRLDGLSRYVGETVERVAVRRLDRRSARRLVRYVLPVEEDLADRIYERSEGNPLHLGLLLRYLRQEGLLQWDGDQWQPRDESAVRAAVPPSLADLFRVRLQQIEGRHGSKGRLQELLQRAAVLGSRFSYDVLRKVVILEGQAERLEHFDDDFDRLLGEGLLIESHGRHEEWYGFDHGVVRDYFLKQLGGAYRARRLHRLAARAREDVYGERADVQASEIAAHWEAARHKKAALRWYLLAARTAMRSTTLRQATTAASAALRLMDELLHAQEEGTAQSGMDEFRRRCQDAGIDAPTYLQILVKLGDLYEGFGEYERAEQHYRRVVKLVGAKPPEVAWVRGGLAECWLGLGHVAWQRGDFEAARWAFDRVLELVKDRPSLEDMGARARRGLARVAWLRGDYARAQELAEQALESALERDDTMGRAKAQWLLGEISRMRGDGESARKRFQESQRLYTRLDHHSGLARNLLSLAQLARYQKDFDQAVELYELALERSEQLDNRRDMGQCYNGLGDVARFRGDHEEAIRFYERALEIYESIGAVFDAAVVYTNLGLTAMQRGEAAEAKHFLEGARHVIEDGEYPYLQAGVEFNLALVEAMLGQDEQSEETLERVLQLSERIPIPELDYARPLEELGRLRSREGRDEEANKLWQRARDIYGELALSDDRARLEEMMSEESDD